jgi:transposase-like protein
MPVVRPAVNMIDLVNEFRSDTDCRATLEELRWPKGVHCPRCDSTKISHMYTRNQYDCDSCRYQFSVTAGTIFHDSHLPLQKWFIATFMICESKKGISANQMKRMLGVSYKTAWYLCHRIRAAMKDEHAPMLSGIVEVDETYVGGKRRHVGRGNRDNKTMVLGAVARGGDVRFKIEKRADRKTLHAFIRAVVDDNAEAIHTDEWEAYKGIADENTRHETVNHHAEEWVRADVHTNTVEGVWSLFKRSIVGSYHQLSAKHMDAYLDEMAFRFNNRSNPYLFRDTLFKLVNAETLEYKELVAN